MKPRVVVARPMPDLVTERLLAEFEPVLAEHGGLTSSDIVERANNHAAEAILLTSDLPFRADAIQNLPDTTRITATCSVGFEHVDIRAAKARKLVVTNTPDVVTDCTADLTFLLILGASRRAAEYGAIMQKGWRRSFAWNEMLGRRVAGKTLGIVGMGRIGRAVAMRARGFGMKVIYTARKALGIEAETQADYYPSLEAMLPHTDILTLHVPGGEATSRLMDRHAFGLLPEGAIFINAARGSLVDEDALVEALSSGRLYAAGLDVFGHEPDYDLRLAALPNVFLTPHAGTSTVETRNAMGFRALDNVWAVCAGRPAIDPLW